MRYWKLVKDEISRILKPGGKVMCFGWNSGGIGKSRGFEMTRVLMVPHGGGRNDTVCTVETKVASTQPGLFGRDSKPSRAGRSVGSSKNRRLLARQLKKGRFMARSKKRQEPSD